MREAVEVGRWDVGLDILANKIYPQVHGNSVVSWRQNQYRYTRVNEEKDSAVAAAVDARAHVEHLLAKMVNLSPLLDFSKGLKVNERE